MKLVDDWKQWYKWWSVWLAAASAAMQAAAVAFAASPAEWRSALPDRFGLVLVVAGMTLAALVPFGRVLQQSRPPCATEEADSDQAGV